MARLDDVVTLHPIHFPKVRVGQNLAKVLIRSLAEEKMGLERGDVVALASKVVSICEGRIVRLAKVQVSVAAKRLGEKWKMDEALTAVVLREAEEILGGVNGFLLTQKNGVITANAGVDLKNSPRGTAVLWPRSPNESARRLRNILERRFHAKVGVEIIDSRVTPLRLGTTGLAIGLSGFHSILDHRGKGDLYGRKVRVTQSNVADDIAAAAHMLMGETTERVAAVVLRNAHIALDPKGSADMLKLNHEKCLIMNAVHS